MTTLTTTAAAVLAACLCLTGQPLHSAPPVVSDPPGATWGGARVPPSLCLATARGWAPLHAPCPRLPVDPFESVGARLWLLHVR